MSNNTALGNQGHQRSLADAVTAHLPDNPVTVTVTAAELAEVLAELDQTAAALGEIDATLSPLQRARHIRNALALRNVLPTERTNL